MRTLVLMHEGAPMRLDIFPGPLREMITDHPDDDVDLWSVWSVPPVGSMASSFEMTADFAGTWAMEMATCATLDHHIASAPAFVVLHARAELIRIWQRRMAERDENFVPVMLRSAAAA